MPDLPEFMKPDAVPFMHDQALKEYGGTHGLKSESLLQNALVRAEKPMALEMKRLDRVPRHTILHFFKYHIPLSCLQLCPTETHQPAVITRSHSWTMYSGTLSNL